MSKLNSPPPPVFPPKPTESKNVGGFNTKVLEQANTIKAYRANDNKNKHNDSDSEDGWSDEEAKSKVIANTYKNPISTPYIKTSVLKPPEVSIFPPPKPNSLNIAPPPSIVTTMNNSPFPPSSLPQPPLSSTSNPIPPPLRSSPGNITI